MLKIVLNGVLSLVLIEEKIKNFGRRNQDFCSQFKTYPRHAETQHRERAVYDTYHFVKTAGQLITEGLVGESVGNKGAAGMRGTTSEDGSSIRSVVEELLAVGGDGELARF